MKPGNLTDSEYNLELTGFRRIVRSPGVATIVLTTGLLIAQQCIIETKGNPDKRNIGTGETSVPVPIKAPMQSEKPVQKINIDTVLIQSIALPNGEIYNFLDRSVNENDTNEALYTALKKKINIMQSSEHNTQATIASIREDIRTRLETRGTNSRALMAGLTVLLEEQKRVEKLSDALNSLQGPHEINKMNAAIAIYHETGGGIEIKENWKDLATAIEEDRKNAAQKSKMGNGWEATDGKINPGAGTIPRVQKLPIRRKPPVRV